MNDKKNKITAIYSDDRHQLTDKEKATHVEIAEYDEKGRRVRSVYGHWVCSVGRQDQAVSKKSKNESDN